MNLTHYCGYSLSWKSPSGCIRLSGSVILSKKTSCAGSGTNEFRAPKDSHLQQTGGTTGSGSTVLLRTRGNPRRQARSYIHA